MPELKRFDGLGGIGDGDTTMTERMRKPEVALLLIAAFGGTLAIASVAAKATWRPGMLRLAPLPTGPLVLPIPCGSEQAHPEPREAR